MKSLRVSVTVCTIVSVLVFVVSLVCVVSTDGANESAGEICAYSLIVSSVSLVLYKPKTDPVSLSE